MLPFEACQNGDNQTAPHDNPVPDKRRKALFLHKTEQEGDEPIDRFGALRLSKQLARSLLATGRCRQKERARKDRAPARYSILTARDSGINTPPARP